MSCARYVLHVWKKRNVCRVLLGKPEEERDHLADLTVAGRIILKLILKK